MAKGCGGGDRDHVMAVLHRAMSLMPRDMVLTDSSARRSFVVNGRHENMVVAMPTDDALRHNAEPDHPLPIACYMLTPDTGGELPPVQKLDQVVSGRGPMSNSEMGELIGLHERTGVLNTTTEEIAELVEQLQRAIATLRPREYRRTQASE